MTAGKLTRMIPTPMRASGVWMRSLTEPSYGHCCSGAGGPERSVLRDQHSLRYAPGPTAFPTGEAVAVGPTRNVLISTFDSEKQQAKYCLGLRQLALTLESLHCKENELPRTKN